MTKSCLCELGCSAVLGVLVTVAAQAGTFSLGQGRQARLVSSKKPTVEQLASPGRPPLEGPLTYLAFTVTDEKSNDELDTTVTAHIGLDGNLLPSATTNFSLGILDSGAATHLLNYPTRIERGIVGDVLSGQVFPVGGVGGDPVEVDVSVPFGLFFHGLQDLVGDAIQTHLTVGQGNFPCGVNTLANYSAGSQLPTAIGAPLLAHFPASVRNSQPVAIQRDGERIASPSVTFYIDPTDPSIPAYGHKVFLQQTPGGDPTVAFFALPDFFDGGYLALLPALIGQLSGSLYETSSASLTVEEGTRSRTVRLLVDTGAQACILSESVAADLSLSVSDPDFEVEVEGIGGSETAPGFYIDQMAIPSSGGDLEYTQIPVVILNLTGPAGAIVDGILGSSLLANRDFVFNGAAAQPYLDISDPVVDPDIRITAIRQTGGGGIEVDWLSEPAAPVLELDAASGITNWTTVSTGELASIVGTMSLTNGDANAIFRLRAP